MQKLEERKGSLKSATEETPTGVMQLKSKNEFAHGGAGPSPKSNKQESNGMKIVPMNYSEAEQSPVHAESPDRKPNFNQKGHMSEQQAREEAAI